MSIGLWSPTYQQSVFKRYHSDKHFSEFLPTRWRQKYTRVNVEQNYVTVTLEGIFSVLVRQFLLTMRLYARCVSTSLCPKSPPLRPYIHIHIFVAFRSSFMLSIHVTGCLPIFLVPLMLQCSTLVGNLLREGEVCVFFFYLKASKKFKHLQNSWLRSIALASVCAISKHLFILLTFGVYLILITAWN